MGSRATQGSRGTTPVTADPWAAFGSIVSGVAVYGLIGWALGLWLHTRWLIPVGILVGAALGTYMVIARFNLGMKAIDAKASRSPASAASDEVADQAIATPTDRQPGADDLVPGPTTSRGDDR